MLNISEKGQINLLATILSNGEKYKSVAELEERMKLSRRSVYFWLKQLNLALRRLKLDDVQHLSQGGYFLTQATLDELQNYVQQSTLRVLNVHQRRQLIVWYLIQHDTHLSLVNLAEKFDVSKTTIIKDFKELTTDLPVGTQVINTDRGKILMGSEEAQRNWVYQQLGQQNSLIISQIQLLPQISGIKPQLARLQEETGNVYSGDASQVLTWYLIWLINRLKDKSYLLTENQDYPLDSVSRWCDRFLAAHAQTTAAEINHLRTLLLAGQLQQVNEDDKFVQQLLVVTEEVARRFSTVSGIDLVTSSFLEALATHLYSTYFRITSNVQFHHANLADVKITYSYLMNMTKYALKPFESFLNTSITDDELALISVYFGGEIKRVSPDWFGAGENADVLLVCTSGIGTSQLLYQQLTKRYPEINFSQPISLQEFQKINLETVSAKLILTTAKLQINVNIPSMWVQAIPTHNDFQKISQELRRLDLLSDSQENKLVHAVLDIITDYARVDDFNGLSTSLHDYFKKKGTKGTVENERPALDELIPAENIQIVDGDLKWDAAVHQLFRPLEKRDIVQSRYADQIIKTTIKRGPYMVIKEGVMLAHAKPEDGVNKLGMSLLILKKPVELNIKGQVRKLRVLFGLAPVDREIHMRALGQLLALLQNNILYQKLLVANEVAQIQQILGDAEELSQSGS
ncbi:BglG family transcription antiterminator [Levilactobacillus tujiorum]|uniref:PTS transporter subunit EIIA n=1 Tax=Levilactobacillus tujiorum TaxID=2912243 RepID=A0ABX1L3L8_9LACO|nr:PTS sugar transporter subunit IIA [Levilactobacillus tujiorum]MCH5463938.1 PTS sugar transporter subunit IIA [Levilactobacillus tujiorum]NLR11556.1 PTS transporter subunit EIIA [Lactobacillus sp. HBUAS51387]NLR28926.1 PTS transporter subunit EIIA [Levilactobacillus tujiorum]